MEKQTNIFFKIIDAFQDFADWLDGRGLWKALKAVGFLVFVTVICLILFFSYRIITQLNYGVEILEKTHDTPEQLQEGFEQDVTDSILVNQEMTKCVYEHGADTMIVAKFHNSIRDLQGKHDFYYSASNEVTANNGNFISSMQNIPVVRLGKYAIPFLENKCQLVKVSGIEDNNWLKSRLQAEDIHTLVSCPLYSFREKLLIGFTELVYKNNNSRVIDDELSLQEDTIKFFKDTTEKISIIISN